MSKLKGKVAVITGGSSGIGLATGQRFVNEGAHVYITGRRQAELDKAVTAIGSAVTAVKGDVASLDDLDVLYKKIAADRRKIDIVVEIPRGPQDCVCARWSWTWRGLFRKPPSN